MGRPEKLNLHERPIRMFEPYGYKFLKSVGDTSTSTYSPVILPI